MIILAKSEFEIEVVTSAGENTLEITEEQFTAFVNRQAKISFDENGVPSLVSFSENEPTLADLRARRASECFPIINRGTLWYNTLTPEQITELEAWYQAWLAVTETMVIPEKPSWIL